MPIYYLTKQKLEELEQEYDNLKKLKQEKFKEGAPAFFEGEDINPDFTSYEEGLEGLNVRLEELESILKNHALISNPVEKDKVSLGASLVLKENLSQEKQFKIVGTLEVLILLKER